ncbi:MAG: D-aminoacyl-tRNA deacylase, partial [Chitinophagaceae bacterium]
MAANLIPVKSLWELKNNKFFMRVIIQRVMEAQVAIDFEIIGKIGKGLLVLVGIEDEDNFGDIEWLSSKIVNLRI